jgi:hypothetical protein
VVTVYKNPDIAHPSYIVAGPDGALWFTNRDSESIGRITTSGEMAFYKGAGIHQLVGITVAPDGALWFCNFKGDSIGRITAVPEVAISPSSGAPGTSVTVTGEGYQPGEQVNVIYKTGVTSPSTGVSLCTTTAATDGRFSCSEDIPYRRHAGAAGIHKIKATGTTSFAEATTMFMLT